MTHPKPDFISYTFAAKLWKYKPKNENDKGSWIFITVPQAISRNVERVTSERPRRGFGAVKILVSIGRSRWGTSMFPDNTVGSYIVPIKAQIRKSEHIDDANKVNVTIEIVGTVK